MAEAGQGMPRDLDRAAKLFRQSAEEGDADAQYALAVMLQTGKGQALNPVEAESWLRRAAAQGHQSATAALRKVESVNARSASNRANLRASRRAAVAGQR